MPMKGWLFILFLNLNLNLNLNLSLNDLFVIWCLEFENCLLFGACNLEFVLLLVLVN